jgi:hypothetical protein
MHGDARVDLAVVNGTIHGYELKSDMDSLYRLREQMRIYNSVLDHMTLVVGKTHLRDAINIIPEWWGVTIAKFASSEHTVSFYHIRDAEENPEKDSIAIANLLWREEALEILDEWGVADGLRSKPRSAIYQRLVEILDQNELRAKVRERLFVRGDWRSGAQLTTNGG